MKISGIYDISTKKNSILSCEAYYYRDTDIEVVLLHNNHKNFIDDFVNNYKRVGVQCVNNLNEMFLAVVCDERNGEIHIFSDITTSQWNMYYVYHDNKIYYSTSMKELLIISNIDRRMNIRAAKAFIANGYVFGEETLIHAVYKLKFGCEITTKNGLVIQAKYSYELDIIPTRKAKKELLSVMRESIVNCIEEDGDIFMPLSGGYDSNFILDTVRINTNRKINAYTIGSDTGKSEIDTVKKNIKYLSNIEHHIEYVDTTYFEYIADIVWRLDGCVFESGVFLQYALAKSASMSGAKYMLCGEGSDEVQSMYYYESLSRVLRIGVDDNENIYIYSDPFIGTNMLILKKSSIMLDSFGIKGKYPFKTKKIEEVSNGVARLNKTNKKYYKRLLSNELNPNILSNLKTTGGTTKLSSAINAEQIASLKKYLSQAEIIKIIDNEEDMVFTTNRTKKLRTKQSMERAYREIREYGVKRGIMKIKSMGRHGDSMTVIKKAYLAIFFELFISGKYDMFFDGDSVPLTTSQILGL